MATLIPALGSCTARMTSGERRLAERLEQKLEDDYLLWYDVPIGVRLTHPDFIVMHPRRGLLVLEVKDWRLATSRELSVPAYVVFTDNTLIAIAESLPADEAALVAIPGIGARKLEQFGADVLDLVRARG